MSRDFRLALPTHPGGDLAAEGPAAAAAAAAAAAPAAAAAAAGNGAAEATQPQDWLEVLMLASKHQYTELVSKVVSFVGSKCFTPTSAMAALPVLAAALPELVGLREAHLVSLMGTVLPSCGQSIDQVWRWAV